MQRSRRLLYVRLKPEALTQLCELADCERRSPQDQGALLLERALGETLLAHGVDPAAEAPDRGGLKHPPPVGCLGENSEPIRGRHGQQGGRP